MLLSIVEGSCKFRTIRPVFDSISVLLVMAPVADVPGTVDVQVRSRSMRLVVEPAAFVHAAIVVNETTMAIRPVHVPIALVLGPVFPSLDTATMSLPKFVPLALVESAIVEFERPSGNQLLVCIYFWLRSIVERAHLLLQPFCDFRHEVGDTFG